MRSKISSTDTDLGGDDEVCKMIVDKFEQLGGGGVSYADIAKRAWEVGRAGVGYQGWFYSHAGKKYSSEYTSSFWIMSQERRIKSHYYCQ